MSRWKSLAATAERYEPAIKLERLFESSHNPRRTFDKAALEELAASLRTKGQLTPLLARPRKSVAHEYELAAGHRRLRAARLAGLATLAVVVRDMSDEELLEILTVENLQRVDLHPMEEALGYHELLKLPDYDMARLSAKVGKSESYLYRRLALAKLSKNAQKAFLDGTIHVGHAELIARAGTHADALLAHATDRWRHPTVSDLKHAFETECLQSLSAAPWKLSDAELYPKAGACTACPKRTGATPALFDDLEGKSDQCLDAACYQLKAAAVLARKRQELTEAGTPFRAQSDEAYGDRDGVFGRYSLTPAKKSTKDAQPTLIVDGPRLGHVIYTTQPKRSSGRDDANPYAAEQRRKQQLAARKATANREAVRDLVLATPLDMLSNDASLRAMLAMVIADASGDGWQAMGKMQLLPEGFTRANTPHIDNVWKAIAPLTTTDVLRLALGLLLMGRTSVYAYGDGRSDQLDILCKVFDVDPADYRKRANDASRAKVAKKGGVKKATRPRGEATDA